MTGSNSFGEPPAGRAPELAEPLLDGIGIQGGDEIAREFRDQFIRHAGRSKQSPPHPSVVTRHGLGYARDIGQEWNALARGDGKRSDGACCKLSDRLRSIVE